MKIIRAMLLWAVAIACIVYGILSLTRNDLSTTLKIIDSVVASSLLILWTYFAGFFRYMSLENADFLMKSGDLSITLHIVRDKVACNVWVSHNRSVERVIDEIRFDLDGNGEIRRHLQSAIGILLREYEDNFRGHEIASKAYRDLITRIDDLTETELQKALA